MKGLRKVCVKVHFLASSFPPGSAPFAANALSIEFPLLFCQKSVDCTMGLFSVFLISPLYVFILSPIQQCLIIEPFRNFCNGVVWPPNFLLPCSPFSFLPSSPVLVSLPAPPFFSSPLHLSHTLLSTSQKGKDPNSYTHKLPGNRGPGFQACVKEWLARWQSQQEEINEWNHSQIPSITKAWTKLWVPNKVHSTLTDVIVYIKNKSPRKKRDYNLRRWVN